jgi:O-6-methylguanine DNA methyltransferase
MNLIHLTIQTREGMFVASYSELGLTGLRFPGERSASTAKTSATAEVRHWHQLTTQAVLATLAGEGPEELPPLDVRSGTEFQQRLWEELLRIAPGQTRSYGELARTLRRPCAARAIGGACGANPIPLLIPCHRVLAANGKIGGFSGGLEWKRRLLALEGVFPESR